MAEATKQIQEYLKEMEARVKQAYKIANEAKSKGYDPDEEVKIPLAESMAERVEGLISTIAPQIKGVGVPKRIAELEKEYGTQNWRVAFRIAEEVAKEKFCKFKDQKEAIEVGIRVGFAYVTVGVVASPLEGFTELKIKKTSKGEDYFCLMYSGPVRSAGGTGASVSVLIADYVRKKMGYAAYDPTEKEIKRAFTELCDYHEKVTNLQYFPSQEETEFLAANLPVQISGDPSEEYEVSNYKDLPRIEANRIRNGFCLVMAECLSLKAPKLWKQLSKWGKEFDMEQWNFLEQFINIQKTITAQGQVKNVKEEKITPNYTFIADMVAGRPVLTYPLRNGGFRLRYGRTRTSGFSSDAIHPSTMGVVNNYIAIGTQLKTERPGKATVISACDSLEGPIVKLKNGNVVRIETKDQAKALGEDIDEILYLGDVLINYGDFLNRAHKLVPCGFNEEWWFLYLKKEEEAAQKILGKEFYDELQKNPATTKVPFELAKKISKELKIPLHPRWIYFWNTLTIKQLNALFFALKNKAAEEEGKIILPLSEKDAKRALELIGIPHKVVTNEYIVIEREDAQALLLNIGSLENLKEAEEGKKPLEVINALSHCNIKDRLGTFIGARMGRPEKAKMRQLKGSPHVLFPIGKEGGRLRCFQSALEKGEINAHFPINFCEACNRKTIYKICEVCNKRTKKLYYCPECKQELEERCGKHDNCESHQLQKLDIQHFFDAALKKLKDRNHPALIKGVRGMTSKDNIPENIIKGILRAKHKICVNKDGTTRYDMTEMGCTHFKPKEIGTPIDTLKKLGYDKDCFGADLVDEDQTLELKPQDIILPACKESMDEGADEVLFRVSQFIDDMLINLYDLPPYYNLKSKEELAGHLTVALSPHTSAGMVTRIIGFSKTQGFFAHPLLHSILRRDCDGDEAAVMLLLDCLINFSKKFLPKTRGATQDAPLVLTSKLIPSEVDDMVFDMDVVWNYPLEFYEAAEKYTPPGEVKISKLGEFLGTEKQYEGLGFTHTASDINGGVRCSAYKSIPTMQEKVYGQMSIAEKIRAVDADDVAKLVIERHFIRDIKGNLRKFSMQQFRCVECNEKFRRPPLPGVCRKCKGKIIFTISEGSIIKYLEPAIGLAEKYNLPPYLKQTLLLTKERVESVFGREKEKQEGLNKWF